MSFTDHCVSGIRADKTRIRQLLERSLMLVTALAPHIGYEHAAEIAKTAHARATSPREAAVRLGCRFRSLGAAREDDRATVIGANQCAIAWQLRAWTHSTTSICAYNKFIGLRKFIRDKWQTLHSLP